MGPVGAAYGICAEVGPGIAINVAQKTEINSNSGLRHGLCARKNEKTRKGLSSLDHGQIRATIPLPM